MTYQNSILILFSLLTMIFLSSCNSDNDSNDIDQMEVQAIIQHGSWVITQFIDSGKDETNNFTGYTFAFNALGVLNANNGANIVEGTWSITTSDSNDDSSDDLDFNIFFNVSNDFEDLNDDWDIISQSTSKIELIDISGGNGGTDYLTFEKN